MKILLLTASILFFSATSFAATFFFDKIKSEAPPPPHMEMDPISYEKTLEQFEKKCTDADCISWTNVMRANLWSMHKKQKACEIFRTLSKDLKHPLHPLFLVKQTEVCTLSKKQRMSIIDALDAFIQSEKPSSWLEIPLRRAQLKLGKADTVLPLSKLLSNKKEKEALLMQGIKDPLVKKELWKISPRFTPISLLKTPQEMLGAAQDALNSNDGGLAIKLSQKALKMQGVDDRKALEIEKSALKMLQEKKEALKVAQKIFHFDFTNFKKEKNLANAKNLITSGINLARAQWTAHQTTTVQKTLKQLEKTLQGHYSLADIYFLRARLAEEQGDLKQALKFLEIATQELPPGKTDKNPYLWNQAWFYFKNSQMVEAVDIFKKIESSDNVETGKKLQAMFWLAKAYKVLTLQKESNKKFRQIIEEDPASYYAFLSYRELGERIPAVPSQEPEELSAPSSFNLFLFRWLISVGEFELAQQMLIKELPLKDVYLSEWQDLFPLYKEAHAFAPVFLKVIKLPPKDRIKMTIKNMDMLFPIVHSDLIQKASSSTGLWSEYIYAIIRQESSFDPQSHSPADAIGLMQILPTIAKVQGKKHHIRFSSKEDLFDPAINISIGSYHLREYWDTFSGKFILSTAGYNASPEAVKTWLRTRSSTDPLVFIEDIPYEETRNYVKLVMRNFINYLRLTTKDENIGFPDWVLTL